MYSIDDIDRVTDALEHASGWVKTPEAWEAAAMIRLLFQENERLRGLVASAADDVADWGCYADKFFQEKHDLEGCISKYRISEEN